MKKRIWIAALLVALLITVCACDASPSEPNESKSPDSPETPATKDADMSGVIFADDTVIYDGKAHTLTVENLPEDITAKLTYIRGGKEITEAIDVGIYTVRADFTAGEKYNTPASRTALLTIGKAKIDTSGIRFADDVIPYDGNAHTLTVENLPAGVTVTYRMQSGDEPCNEAREPGQYDITATFAVSENYEDIPQLSAKLTINPASADMSGVVFKSATLPYDGSAHTLEAENLPEGVTAAYTYSLGTEILTEAKNAGTYTVTANFTVPTGYNPIPSCSAILTIEKAEISTDGLLLEDGFFLYDGTAHSLAVSGDLPAGITGFTYENNGKEEIGIYTVKASPTVDGNHKAEKLEATMTIFGVTAKMEVTDNSGKSYASLDVTAADGVFYTLKATPDFVFEDATYTYDWYKNTKGYMRTQHGDSISVSKLTDGGKYTCKITATMDDKTVTGECSITVIIRSTSGCYMDESGSLILPMDVQTKN